MTKSRKPRGRLFFAGPGPTNIPDSVLHAVGHVTVDFNDPDFVAVFETYVAGLKRILRTTDGTELFMYTASGHGAWEATLANLFSPGDTVLMLESGYFSEAWSAMARAFAVEVQTVAADWRRGVNLADVTEALRADRGQGAGEVGSGVEGRDGHRDAGCHVHIFARRARCWRSALPCPRMEVVAQRAPVAAERHTCAPPPAPGAGPRAAPVGVAFVGVEERADCGAAGQPAHSRVGRVSLTIRI